MTVNSIASADFEALSALKFQAKTDANAALPEVAKQFEAIFLQSMLKSMRMSQHFLDDSSPFKGKTEATFQEMLDAEYSARGVQGQGLGLAALLTKQLSTKGPETNPAPISGDIKPVALSNTTENRSLIPSIEPSLKKDSLKSEGKAGVDDFVKSIWPYAQKAASVLGLDPKILVAQAALETGWGQFVARNAEGESSNNVFNIKKGSNAHHDSVTVKTTEYIANTPIRMQAEFRKYPTVENSFEDYIALLQGNNRYKDALANTENPERFMQALHKAGYATDPQYSSKILSIYHGDELQQAVARCGLET
jgi:flagellar protein FlgJ